MSRSVPSVLVLGAAAASLVLFTSTAARAQATVKTDGQFRAAVGLGASVSSGNSRSTNLSFTADGVRATDHDKTTVFGNAQYTRTDGTTTAEKARLGGRHDADLTPKWFGFGSVEFERNVFANLSLRSQAGLGVGYHVIRTDPTQFDVFAGVTYTQDRYDVPMLIDDEQRKRYGYASVLLAEESNHQLTASTTFKQRLSLQPSLANRGEYRATLDAGLSVAMSDTLSLTVGLTAGYNSEPGPGRRSTDTLLTTGISVKFE